MSIKCISGYVRVFSSTLFMLTLFFSVNGWASRFDKDPITETQSGVVAVTEENIKDEGRPGAPAPTFKIVGNTDKFLTKDPLEEIVKEKENKEFGWWFLPDEKETDKNNDKDKEGAADSEY